MSDQLKDRATEIVKSVLLPAMNVTGEGFHLDGEWFVAHWGCDTMDHLRDEIQAELERLSAPPRWTPIEDAGEWSMVICRAVNGNGSVLFWDQPRPIEEFRAIAKNDMKRRDVRFFVYPAPPEFNPEDYEVLQP